jgi:ribonuclease-3
MEGPRVTADLQEKIGHSFGDVGLLERALVHRSWAHDQHPPAPDNERLEFLGDAVLGLVVAERLFSDFADDEGRLTRARADLVRRETLADQARSIGLGSWLLLGKGEEGSGGRDKDSILCDAFEALIGAIYSDAGLEAARGFIERVMVTELGRRGGDGEIHSPRDPRTVLQEFMQSEGQGTPDYRIIGSDGPDHDPVWTVEVASGLKVVGRGVGGSKQDAARRAAEEALLALRGAGGGVR